jgi:hypothetical protein
MMKLRDHDQNCEHGYEYGHQPVSGGEICPGGAEVKGPQFTPPHGGVLVVTEGAISDWGYHSTGVAVAKDQRYQLIEVDPIENPMEDVNPFRTLVMHDAVKAEVTRQLGPAMIRELAKIRFNVSVEDPF